MMTTNPEQRVVNSQPKSVSPSQPYASVVASQSMQPTENLLPNDLHAEISTLKSARQTDAYLLSLKEREITELRNLLQAKTQTHEPSLLSPQSATSTTNANAIDVYLQTSNNDSTDTLVFSEGEPIHITDVTKLCDSPSISNPKCTPESQLLFGIKKQPSTVYDGTTKRVGGIQFGSLNMKSPNTLPPPPCALENLETQFSQSKFTDEQAFSDRDLASFKSLSLHAPTFAGPSSILSSSPATEFSPTEFCVGSLEKTSPPSVEQKLLDARGCSFDDETQNALYNSAIDISQMGSNIWGKYPSYSLAASFKSKEQSGLKFRQRSLNRDLMADDSRPISRVFDFENSNRFKNSKFNLDPNSPAYFPISSATQFRQQARLHSVPTYSDNKSAWNQTRHFSQTNTAYPEFDDIATENNLYSAVDVEYSNLNIGFFENYKQQSLYIPDFEDYGSLSTEFSEFGDIIQYQIFVEKIIQTNDQPASLHLQQNIKYLSSLIHNPSTDSASMASAIRSRNQLLDAVKPQALSLMRNRFGNFLMQRCLEYGTRDQVKALDVCDDEIKLTIVNELFRAIPETITHRFACHVWQRVFETKWGVLPTSHPSALDHFALTATIIDPPLQQQQQQQQQQQINLTFSNRSKIVARVDAALKGQWHLVANDENGSLVVQCVFENCADSDKREIVKEVLVYAADIAKGQWGNWVIQHLLDHGTPGDKSHIFKVVARNVYSMSVDQFASKVVEKVLKSCQRRELYDIVDVVISSNMRENGSPGILDMMNNQYANYVVQHMLTLSDPSQREICVRLIAPHLPVLRGSKYGQRVAAIVEKHIRSCQPRFGSVLNMNGNTNCATTQATINGLNQFSRTGALTASPSFINGNMNSNSNYEFENIYASSQSGIPLYTGNHQQFQNQQQQQQQQQQQSQPQLLPLLQQQQQLQPPASANSSLNTNFPFDTTSSSTNIGLLQHQQQLRNHLQMLDSSLFQPDILLLNQVMGQQQQQQQQSLLPVQQQQHQQGNGGCGSGSTIGARNGHLQQSDGIGSGIFFQQPLQQQQQQQPIQFSNSVPCGMSDAATFIGGACW